MADLPSSGVSPGLRCQPAESSPSLRRPLVAPRRREALIVLVPASPALGGSATTSPRTLRVTLDDKANDAGPADLDLPSVSLAKRDGRVIVRVTVRGPITDNASYTTDMAIGVAYTRVVAKRKAGRDSFRCTAMGSERPTSPGRSTAGL